MTLKFFRNKVVEVEPRADGSLSVSWRLTDDLFRIKIGIVVLPPELEIIETSVSFMRFSPKGCENAEEMIKNIEGVCIGPGLRKIIRGLLGGPEGSSVLSEAVLECCNAVILHFTRPGIEIMESIHDEKEKIAGARAMIQASPRLVRSCIAFADDSPIMKGLNL